MRRRRALPSGQPQLQGCVWEAERQRQVPLRCRHCCRRFICQMLLLPLGIPRCLLVPLLLLLR
jgi:hypothetical protein